MSEHNGGFAYNAPAELFPTRGRRGNRADGISAFRQGRGSHPIRDEQLSPQLLIGAHLESATDRFDSEGNSPVVRE